MKIQKKYLFFFGGGSGQGGSGWGGQGGTKSVTHPCTHPPTHARSKSNMPHQLFQSWGHNKNTFSLDPTRNGNFDMQIFSRVSLILQISNPCMNNFFL